MQLPDTDPLLQLARQQVEALFELKRQLIIKGEGLTKKNMIAELHKVLVQHQAVTSPQKAAPRRTKPMNAMTEAEFVAFLETEPSLQGVDVKREIGKCEFWCKANGFQPTRARVVNWMKRADRMLVGTHAGQSSFAPKKPDTISEPAGWREWAKNNLADPSWADKQWSQLDRLQQEHFRKQLSKQNAA